MKIIENKFHQLKTFYRHISTGTTLPGESFVERKFRVFRNFCPFLGMFDPRKKCFRLLVKVNPTRNVLKCGFTKVNLEKQKPNIFNVVFQTVDFLI